MGYRHKLILKKNLKSTNININIFYNHITKVKKLRIMFFVVDPPPLRFTSRLKRKSLHACKLHLKCTSAIKSINTFKKYFFRQNMNIAYYIIVLEHNKRGTKK